MQRRNRGRDQHTEWQQQSLCRADSRLMLCDSAGLSDSNPRAGALERATFDQREVDHPACALLVALNGYHPAVSPSVEPLLRAQPGDLGAAARSPNAAESAQLGDLNERVVWS